MTSADYSNLLNQFESWVEHIFQSASIQGTFLIIAIIASILLVISLLLDGIFDFLNFGDGPLSLTTIGAFGALFGWVGYAAYGFGVPVSISALLGALVGAAGGVGAYFLSKLLQNSTSSASFGESALVGATAAVTLPIPANGSYGEVALVINGQRNTFAALANEPIKRGAQVRITSNLTSSSVLVEPVAPATPPAVSPSEPQA